MEAQTPGTMKEKSWLTLPEVAFVAYETQRECDMKPARSVSVSVNTLVAICQD
jgi:hypothetical protein